MIHVANYHNYPSEEEFLSAIASGEIATVLLPDEQRSWAIRWLREQSKLVDDLSLGEALESIARQLYAAVCRENESGEE